MSQAVAVCLSLVWVNNPPIRSTIWIPLDIPTGTDILHSMMKTILFSLAIGILCFGPWYCLVLAAWLVIPFMEYA